MTATLPPRSTVPPEVTWDLAALYPSIADWEAAIRTLEAEQTALAAHQGQLASSPANLLAWLETSQRLDVLARQVVTYAQMRLDVDAGDQGAVALRERAIGVATRLAAATAFAEPELLAAGRERIEALLDAEPSLQPYRHALDNLLRRGPYVRSGEVEQLLAASGEALGVAASAYQLLAEGELPFAPAHDRDGKSYPVSGGTLDELLQSPDRALRASAWTNYQNGFLGFKSTIAALYAGSVKAEVFRARARGYGSALEASLHESNVPRGAYDTVIAACNRHLPLWHRYWELRRHALGLPLMAPYDIWAPLGPPQPMSYGQAVELICAAVAPLGAQYSAVSRAGLSDERWVDIYPNQGKTSGAYSGGSYRGKPYILLNYDNSLSGASTLAHELGHSMHTWLADRAQLPINAGYSLFVAEVASNFNQALLRGHLLQQQPARDLELAVIEEAMDNFHRYLFLMPILAQFEQRTHELVEAGEPLTADGMGQLLSELFARGYGPAVELDPARNGIVWAQFPHLYESFYVFQYASGIAAANALAEGVLRGDSGAAERYLQALAAGGSRYPLEALALAGIDMTSPEPMDRAFAVLAGFVERLERLVG